MKWVHISKLISIFIGVRIAFADQMSQEQSSALELEKIARQLENPVSSLKSFYFQNHFNFGVGPEKSLQYVLDLAPVYPVKISQEGWRWNNRPILPLVSQPGALPGQNAIFGQGDLQYQAYFSPPRMDKVSLGFGPLFVFPTAVAPALGSGKWSAGPGGVVLVTVGSWVFGGVMSQIWSFAGDSSQTSVSELTLQSFIYLNLKAGWYLTSSSSQTGNWRAPSGDPWSVTLGGGVGKIFRVGDQALNFQLGAFDDVRGATNSGSWSFSFQFAILFPGE